MAIDDYYKANYGCTAVELYYRNRNRNRNRNRTRTSGSPLYDEFNAIEGGETTFYYLKLKNKFNETRYKIGVTLGSVEKRYSGHQGKYKVLYEKKLTHANTIEKQILNKYGHLVTDESLLGTNGTEIFRDDILNLG